MGLWGSSEHTEQVLQTQDDQGTSKVVSAHPTGTPITRCGLLASS